MKFYQLSPEERRAILEQDGLKLDEIDADILSRLNLLSENVVAQMRLPLGIVQTLPVNGQTYTVPMVTEEPSVIAAANHGAHIFAKNNGVTAVSKRSGIYGQIVMKVDQEFHLENLKAKIPQLITEVNQKFASLIRHGGGLKEISAKTETGLLYMRLLVDPAEAMGANKTNSILEYLAQKLLSFTGITEKLFAILSNYPSQLTTAKVELDPQTIGGNKVAERIVLLSKIAHDNVYRAVTNNKGIMNGVDAILLATGNDYRAIEAAVGVLASESGQYRSISEWKLSDGKLVGELTLPLAIGTVGGSISARKDVQQAFRILGTDINVHQLAEVIAAIGLANNLAAMLAISTTGIQAGHMKLQARNLVAGLQATKQEKQLVYQQLIQDKKYTLDYAQLILKRIREEK